MPHQILVASPPTGDAFAITRVESLAQLITKRASKQTYYTIRLLVDRNRMLSAYCAYAYFRWVDDRLDQPELGRDERLAFLQRQLALLEQCYRGAWPDEIAEEERMLIDLVRGDQEDKSGLQSYIRNMFAVMTFDANRRGRVISERELIQYEQQLAMAVTDALHYFIGNDQSPLPCQARYLSAIAAHITHMLRDTYEDVELGYFNIPSEFLTSHGIAPTDIESEPYKEWVKSRVQLAHQYFTEGEDYLSQVKNTRCRIAGYTYVARFIEILDTIESENYALRPAYPESKTFSAGLRMCWLVATSMFGLASFDQYSAQ